MKKLVFAAAVLLASLASSKADALGVGADLGYSRLLNGDGLNGYGFDVYVRPPLGLPFVDVDLMGGYHRFDDNGVALAQVPVMVGARLNLPIPGVSLFAGAHLGLMHTAANVTLGSTNLQFSNSGNDFAFNVGGGWNFIDLAIAKLGIGVWYYQVSDDAKTKMLTIGLDAGVGIGI